MLGKKWAKDFKQNNSFKTTLTKNAPTSVL